MLNKIELKPHTAKNLSESIDYCPAEISTMKDLELIFYTEDFMRRRTLLAQTVPQNDLTSDPGFQNLIECLSQ